MNPITPPSPLEKNLTEFLNRYPGERQRVVDAIRNTGSSKFRFQELETSVAFLENDQIFETTQPGFFPTPLRPDTACRVAIFFGFGMGGQLLDFLRRGPKEIQQIVIIEPSMDRFLFALSSTEFKKIFQEKFIHWIVGKEFPEFFSDYLDIFSRPPNSSLIKAVQFIKHPGLAHRYEEYFLRAQKEWELLQNYLLNAYGNFDDSLLGIQNLVKNTHLIEKTPGIRSLKKHYTGKNIPAIVVSAGPSLKKSLPLLKEMQNKALIISSDATISVLLENGIEPHFAGTIERADGCRKYFEAIKNKNLRTQLVSYPLVPETVTGAFPGDQWIAFRDYALHQALDEDVPRGIVSSFSSVAHFNVFLAEYLGASHVVLVGQDLSFDPETFQSHTNGVAYEEWTQAQSEEQAKAFIEKYGYGRLRRLYGNKTESVYSHNVWYQMLKEFGSLARMVSIPIYNATDGGARIPGMEWKDLSSFSHWPVQDDLLKDIPALRKKFKGKGVPWSKYCSTVEAYEARLRKLQAECLGLKHLNLLSAEQKKTTIQILRSSVEHLMRQRDFVVWVLEPNALTAHSIELEWMALIPNGDHADKQFELLDKWFTSMADAAQRVRTTLQTAPGVKENSVSSKSL